MLGIDIRAARAAWTVFLFALLVATAYTIRETLAVFVAALFFAYMLSPMVELIARHSPRYVSRTLALSIVYLALVALLVAAAVSIGSRVADEIAALGERLPSFFQNPDWIQKIPLPSVLEPLRDRMMASIGSQLRAGGKDWMSYATSAGSKLVTGISLLFFVVLVPILAFFFLKDGPSMRETFVGGLINARQKALVEDILNDVHLLLGQYIRSLLLLSLGTFTTYSIFLSFTGAAYVLLLAGTAAILEFIPVVGPLAAGVIVVLVSAFSGYTHIVWFLGFWLLYRLLQDYVISPYLMSAGVELHPLLVLFGVLAGERIAGIPGMFFSVPVIATLRVIYVRALRARRQREVTLVPET